MPNTYFFAKEVTFRLNMRSHCLQRLFTLQTAIMQFPEKRRENTDKNSVGGIRTVKDRKDWVICTLHFPYRTFMNVFDHRARANVLPILNGLIVKL